MLNSISCAAEQFHTDTDLKAVDRLHRTTRKPGSGRKKGMLTGDDRRPLCMAVNDHTASSRQLVTRWSTATGILMSASPIRRGLLHHGLRERVPL